MPDDRLERTRKAYCEVDPTSSRMCDIGTKGCVVDHLTKEQRERRVKNFKEWQYDRDRDNPFKENK